MKIRPGRDKQNQLATKKFIKEQKKKRTNDGNLISVAT